MRLLSLVFLFSIFLSCSKKGAEQVLSAKREALYFLTTGDCKEAQELLESVTPENDDSAYISLYASVFECYASYSQMDTVIDELSTIQSDTTNLFTTLAAFDSAQEVTSFDDVKYTNILKAISIISDSSPVNGSAGRVEHFGAGGGGDLNYQALFLTTIGLAKYLAAYGNVDSSGNKGSGGGTEVCLAQYNYGQVNTIYLDVLGADSCSSGTTSNGETSINTSDTDYLRRLCEGVVLYNQFVDLLVNLVLPGDASDLGNLVDVASVLEDFNTVAAAALGITGDSAAITTYGDIRSVTGCIEAAEVGVTNSNHLETYFSLFLEGNHN